MNYIRLGQRIQETRIACDISQKDLARCLACSPKHLGNIERGVSRPSLECLLDISLALNVSIEYLLSDSIPSQTLTPQSELIIRIDEFLEKEQQNLQQFRYSLKCAYQGDDMDKRFRFWDSSPKGGR